MATADDDLAALIGSRLCHDLVSPLGAIGNGMELLQMTLTVASPELDLVNEAVRAAQGRIRLFRFAFGRALADQQVQPEALNEALQAVAANGRITVHTAWPAPLTAPLTRPRARRLALAALCAESALAYGGEMTLTASGIEASAPRLKLDETLWHPLLRAQPPHEPTAATVHFALLALSGPVDVSLSDTALRIRV